MAADSSFCPPCSSFATPCYLTPQARLRAYPPSKLAIAARVDVRHSSRRSALGRDGRQRRPARALYFQDIRLLRKRWRVTRLRRDQITSARFPTKPPESRRGAHG